MKILLVGEYSGVHTNLAKALRDENINVVTLSDGDSYKNFKSDITIKYNTLQSKYKIVNLILIFYYYFIEFIGVKGLIQILFYFNKIKRLKGYDVVQIINPVALSGFGSIVNILFIYFLKSNNKKLFLCALGDDYYWVKSELKNSKSLFSLMGFRNFSKYLYSLKYVYGLFFPLLNKCVVHWSNKIIPGLYDYYLCYEFNEKCTEIVPIIIYENKDAQPYKYSGGLITIFHGWQLGKEHRKGNNYFDEAINSLPDKYRKMINYEIVGNLPYDEYITKFKDCIIFFDQCLSYDKGVNALLGLRDGKVVFSGAKNSKFKNCECVIDSEPDVELIRKKLIFLLNDPYVLESYSLKSLNYIKNIHNPRVVLEKYMRIWGGDESL